jgi:xylose isomerase
MHAYTGYFGIDINPERIPVDIAISNSIDAIRASCDRINSLDHAAIIESHLKPDRSRGWLEAYLIRARASRPDALPSLERFS